MAKILNPLHRMVSHESSPGLRAPPRIAAAWIFYAQETRSSGAISPELSQTHVLLPACLPSERLLSPGGRPRQAVLGYCFPLRGTIFLKIAFLVRARSLCLHPGA